MLIREFPQRPLSDKEQETFRREFQDKEREIQRYIGVYLSGLVIVTGWVIGPQSRPVIAMALGNNGYNIYAFLIFIVLNMVFMMFLINKSLIVHEITQFMTYLAKPDSSYVFWESWRRSPQSATKPVRSIYVASLGVLPFCASLLLMYGAGHVVFGDPAQLLRQLQQSENPAVQQDNSSRQDNGSLRQDTSSGNTQPAAVAIAGVTSEKLTEVYRWAKVWFVIVGALHFFPFYFFYQNWIPTNRRWKRLHQLRRSDGWFDELKELSIHGDPLLIEPTVIKLYNKVTKEPLGTLSEKQLQFLQENLVEDRRGDHDYHIHENTIEFLKGRHADKQLLRLLKESLGKKKELEIEWEREST